jgi:hypothetical protein
MRRRLKLDAMRSATTTSGQAVLDLFEIWWERHGDKPIALRHLHDDVNQAADPQGRGRHYLSSQLEKLAGTRMAGFVFTRQAPAGKWGVATYALPSLASLNHQPGSITVLMT